MITAIKEIQRDYSGGGKTILKKLLIEEEAQTLVEYAIIVFVLVVASYKAIELFRDALKNYFLSVADNATGITGPLP